LVLWFDDVEDDVLKDILETVNNAKDNNNIKDIINYKIKIQDLEIDLIQHQVYKGGLEIALTYTEFEILILLAKHPGKVFSKEKIYDTIWKEPYYGDYNIIMSHIRNIREKIEDDPSKPVYIQTVWGVGYRFNKNVSSGL